MAFVRIDFYDTGGKPYFGEFCLHPGSDLGPFAADWIDIELGGLWLDALGIDALAGDASDIAAPRQVSEVEASQGQCPLKPVRLQAAFEKLHAVDDREEEGG